jgi:uncharacterized membrane protein
VTRRARGSRWDAIRTAVTGALWPIPALAVVAAIGLGIALPELDQALAFGEDPVRVVFTGGPSAARTILSAIASSLISVTTLLFSLTIVTLQLASSQYSPRLLQTFVRDRVVQACLGILLGTFVFSLVVLRSVRSADEAQGSSFVPRISVTVAFLLTLASVGALVAFLSHQTRQLRVETMMRDVHVEAGTTLRRLLHQLEEDGQPDTALPEVPAGARPVRARHSGFLVQVAEGPLLAAAAEARCTLRLLPRPGDPVIEGTPVAWAWVQDPGAELPVDDLEAALRQHLVVGYEREDLGDPGYGLRKLVDIAARALSPGVNDPTTAVHALSHVSDLLGLAAGRTTWHRRVGDDGGAERLLVPSWDFAALLDLALTQPRHYGREDPTVVARLFGLLAEVGWRVDGDAQRAAIARQVDLLGAQVRAAPPAGWTTDDLRRRVAAVEDALAGRWPLP